MLAALAIPILALASDTRPLAKLEPELKEAVRANPNSFDANYSLGEYYLHTGRLLAGIPYMERACALNPDYYVSRYDLALALFDVGNYEKAGEEIRNLLAKRNSADLHDLLGDIEEKQGSYIAAANEYQAAARMEPTERHILDWGSELLVHNDPDAAIHIFERGIALHPKSIKLRIGLGIAAYENREFQRAVNVFCAASDLNPSSWEPYLLLDILLDLPAAQTAEVEKRLRRSATTQPNNAQALYYYAVFFLNRDRDVKADIDKAERLLQRSVGLDPHFGKAYLQLGIIHLRRGKYDSAIEELTRSIQLNPHLTDAYFQLALADQRTGATVSAEKYYRKFQKLRKQEDETDKNQRAKLNRFVISIKNAAGDSQ